MDTIRLKTVMFWLSRSTNALKNYVWATFGPQLYICKCPHFPVSALPSVPVYCDTKEEIY